MTQGEITLALALGVMILGAGSLSMLVVRLTSPGLQGVGRFSAAFAAGALGSGLQLVHGAPVLSVVGTDVAFLSFFVLIHLAVLRLSKTAIARLWHALVLIGIQVAVDLAYLNGHFGFRVRVSSLGFLIAAQALTTVAALRQLLRREVRAPAAYCIVLLLGFIVVDGLRSLLIASGRGGHLWNQRLGFAAFLVFLVIALGLAFGFFWMTTSSLTAQVEHLASTDPLTRVFNRRVFLRWCEKELLRSQRSGVPFSLLMLDLDHFKQINDSFGHRRGDEVLVSAVERMQDSVRGIDVLCRWGGEEFAVLLPNAPLEATRTVAERIRENIYRMEVALTPRAGDSPEASRLTISIGAATYRDLDDSIAEMLVRADEALYRAKSEGRNRVLAGV